MEGKAAKRKPASGNQQTPPPPPPPPCRPCAEGANYQWRKMPPRAMSIVLVAGKTAARQVDWLGRSLVTKVALGD